MSAALLKSVSLAAMQANFQRIGGEVTAPFDATVSEIVQASMRVDLEPLLRALKAGKKIVRRFLPPNFPALLHLWPQMTQLASTEQLCLVWVPRVGIVEEILAASDRDGREQVLTVNMVDIVADCRAAVIDVAPELQDVITLLRCAYEAHDAGHLEAAQALATCVLDSMLEQILAAGAGKILGVVKKAAKGSESNQLTAMVVKDALAACDSTLKNKGSWKQEPDGYFRNASIHAASTSTYTPVNSVKAVLLATSVACMLSNPLTAFQRIREAASSKPARPLAHVPNSVTAH